MSEFRVEFNSCVMGENDPWYSEIVGSYELADTILNSVANYTLMLHECSLMEDYSNYGIVQQKVDGEWIGFED